jgi:hypothetical protein
MTSKADKLRDERAALLAKLKRERDDEAACRAEIDRQIKTLQDQQAKKQGHLDGCAKQTDRTLAELDRKITAVVTAEKVDALRVVAAELDEHGHNPERLHRLERLTAELAYVGRFALKSHEHRMMAFKRMRRDPTVSFHGPGYSSWSALVDTNLRPGQEQAA